MDNKEIFYEAMEKVTGISREDFDDYRDVNLIEDAILDSLAIAGLLMEISVSSGKSLKMDDFAIEDFENIDRLCEAVMRQL